MPNSLANPRALAAAVLAELAMAPVGLLLCWLTGVDFSRFLPRFDALPWSLLTGALATLPMLIGLVFVLRVNWSPLVRLRRQTEQIAKPLVHRVGIAPLAMLSLAAGLGEEVLFRGALQPLLGTWFGAWGGVLAAAVLFGFAHPVSREYGALAMLIGMYLGGLTLLTGDLVPAILAHAAYDFVALCWLRYSWDKASREEIE